MKKLLFLINPHAGKTSISSNLIKIIDIFIKGGYEVEVLVTQSSDHMREVAESRGGEFDTVVCCGGDGTLSICAEYLLKSDKVPELGYIPAGTTNDFARARGIPLDPVKAAKAIVGGKRHEIDVGYFGDTPYLYVAAFGAFSDVSYATSRSLKRAIGHAAYVLGGIKELVKIKDYHIKFNINGEVIEDDFIYGMLSNTTRVGGFKLNLFKEFNLDDGLIDITLVRKPKGFIGRSRLMNALVSQRSDGIELLQFRADSVSYESDSKIRWTLDGEYGGAFYEKEVTIRRKTLTMLY